MQRITIIIGLPGSGKTTYIENNPDFKDTFICDDYHKSGAEQISKEFIGSVYYQDLISALCDGKDVVLSDIAYCKQDRLDETVSALSSELQTLEIEAKIGYVYFENNPQACKKNVMSRNRRVQRELDYIDKVSQYYCIPPDHIPIPVFEKSSF